MFLTVSFLLVAVRISFTRVAGTTLCYKCPNGVDNPTDCYQTGYCASGEACSAQTTPVTSAHTYTTECRRLPICQILVNQQMEQCKTDPSLCSGQNDGTICNTCCANDYCNHESCHQIKARLWMAYQAHQLDMQTLYASTGFPLPGVTDPPTTTAVVTNAPHINKALQCLHCYSGVPSADQCPRIQTCAEGYSCYTLQLADNSFRMGCKLTLACDDAYTLSHYSCFKCCSDSWNCNANLCGASSQAVVGK